MKRLFILTTMLFVITLAACGTTTDTETPVDPAKATLIETGKTVFQANCSACHTTSSEDVLVGPSMVGLASRAGKLVDGLDTRAYIEQSILHPGAFINEGFQNLMPATYANSLSTDEVEALIEYLLTFE
jgi:mono/diheme cytochrome c family protein